MPTKGALDKSKLKYRERECPHIEKGNRICEDTVASETNSHPVTAKVLIILLINA